MSQFDCGAVIQQTVCPWPVWLRWVALAAASLPCVAAATSMQVAPVRMVLSTVRPVASMTVGNGEDVEIAVQAEVFAWSQENGKDVYRATQDVLVNPSIFRLPADSQQIVRIGLRVVGDAKERSYRIFLQQLPRDQALPTDTSAGVRLQTLLRVGVPIFVAPVVATTQQVQWHLQTVEADAGPTKAPMQGKRQVLVFDNRGSEHVQLTHVVVRSEAGVEIAQKSLSHYVLAGQSAVLPIDLPPLAPDTALRVEARSDAAIALPDALVRVPRVEATPR